MLYARFKDFMIEIDIPTIDPIQHKPKIFLGMTSRQCICIVPGIAVAAGLFVLTCKFSLDLAVILATICITPSICLGWITPYNMKFEDFVRLLYFNTFVANPKRIYKTDNEEVQKQLTIKEREELEKKKKNIELEKKKKNNKSISDKTNV